MDDPEGPATEYWLGIVREKEAKIESLEREVRTLRSFLTAVANNAASGLATPSANE